MNPLKITGIVWFAIIVAIFMTLLFIPKETESNGFWVFWSSGLWYHILKVDITKNKIWFWGYEYFQKNENLFSQYHRFYAHEYFKKQSQKNIPVKWVINAQFFNAGKDPTFMSFPLKVNGTIINDYMDNDIAKRTLIKTKQNQFFIKEGFERNFLTNADYTDVIVAFSPEVDALSSQSIGRTYVGMKENMLYFFIANSKTQNEMNSIIQDEWILPENIIMFDGGPSSQFAIDGEKTYYGDWKVPHFVVVEGR